MSESVAMPHLANLAFVEDLYARFQTDPASVSPEWREYFRSLRNGDETSAPVQLGPTFRARSVFNAPASVAPRGSGTPSTPYDRRLTSLQDRVDQFIRAYRNRGHMIASLDPLEMPRPTPPELELEYYGFTEEDMNQGFSTQTIHCGQGKERLKLHEIVSRMKNTYCRSIGVQYMHIDDISVRRWLRDRMEGTENRIELTRDQQLRILTRLTDAVVFEEFVRKKFIGAKSFSLEGCESLIPLLDLAIEKAGDQGTKEIVFGMAHRGRLNVLANIMEKSPAQIFREFADKDPDLYMGRGDVKYHQGHSNNWKTASGETVHLSLCFNPSHLEFVNPVALGRTRAKQDRARDENRRKVMTVLIHGDAGFAGQGIVQETLNLSQLPGYRTGGTLHVIVNNQIGFTTSPEESRSCPYATDVAKMLQVPIFHVNGENPEAVAQVVHVAMEFRNEFQRDVVIDMYGYRRMGHNEADEPSFTQPMLYDAIGKRKSVREGYLDHLLELDGLTQSDADKIEDERRQRLEKELSDAQSGSHSRADENLKGYWSGYQGGPEVHAREVSTGVKKERLAAWLRALNEVPDTFNLHPKIKKFTEHRRAMAEGKRPLDWAAAEALALASVACEGYRVRLSGQDSERGTFSQRHAVLYDYKKGHKTIYVPLNHLDSDQAPVEILNSPLSEIGVLGFDYGYSLDMPNGLVLWEAQFGDFWNAAQVIVDQFIASAEDKWKRLSNLVLLLPHGFEGQGPEHSSARLERFLLLAAEDNIQVAYPTTPSQYFHLLRRQVLRKWHKPLVIMTPKSLLRHKRVTSSLDDLAGDHFARVLPDLRQRPASEVKRILICSGKIYYELAEYRDRHKRDDVAILRLEQLYPLRKEMLREVLQGYEEQTPVFWVQEEPENMGAWRFLHVNFGEDLFGMFPFEGIYRPASASPATGSTSSHKQEQQEIIDDAFGF